MLIQVFRFTSLATYWLISHIDITYCEVFHVLENGGTLVGWCWCTRTSDIFYILRTWVWCHLSRWRTGFDTANTNGNCRKFYCLDYVLFPSVMFVLGVVIIWLVMQGCLWWDNSMFLKECSLNNWLLNVGILCLFKLEFFFFSVGKFVSWCVHYKWPTFLLICKGTNGG